MLEKFVKNCLFSVMPITPVMTPSMGGFLSPQPLYSMPEICQISPSFNSLESKELLNKITGYGLKIDYRFTRSPHLISAAMTNIQLIFHNGSSSTITNIRVGNKVCTLVATNMSELETCNIVNQILF